MAQTISLKKILNCRNICVSHFKKKKIIVFFESFTVIFIMYIVEQEYYVVDASEGQLLVVVHHGNMSNLYISGVNDLKFSLSLEKVFYYNPKGARNETWLRWACLEYLKLFGTFKISACCGFSKHLE